MPKYVVLLALFSLMLASLPAAGVGACAHRGDQKNAPENTVPAFISAVEKGAHQIEFDVYTTSDKRLIVIHDSTVDRTTNGKGKVCEMSFEAIRALDAGSWFDARFKGTKVPTLEEVLAAIPEEVQCNVHLKNAPGVAPATAEVIAKMERMDQCFLACSVDQIAEARQVVPAIRTCNMSRQTNDRPAYMALTFEKKAQFIQLHKKQGLKDLAKDVAELHGQGVTVNFFGTQEPDLIRKLAEAKVDYILTDDLDLCLKVLAEYGVKPVKLSK